MKFEPKHFSKEINKNFHKTLKQRVNEYFKTKKISKKGNTALLVKGFVMILLFVIPYGIMISGLVSNIFLFLALWVFMGVAVAGIGFSIMHDANHSTFSDNKKLNNLFSYSAQLIGANATTWKIQHNVLHHTYTNVSGYDQDIETTSLLRFYPHQEKFAIHKYQYIYAWFLYSLMTLSRVTFTDFKQLVQFKQMNLLKHTTKEWMQLIAWKIIYLSYIIVLPILLLDISWYFIVLGFVLMHLTTGFILSTVFQTAHIVPESEFIDSKEKNIQENWAVHQIKTTANFAPNSKLFSWYIGGLNYQIEHHLFPNISHVHYAKISRIVKETAKEFNIQYHSYTNFLTALVEHTKMLKTLGNA